MATKYDNCPLTQNQDNVTVKSLQNKETQEFIPQELDKINIDSLPKPQLPSDESMEPPSQSSSMSTIFAIFNCMVGSVVLLLPINFGSTGIILSLVIMACVGFISFSTCMWVINNSSPNERQLSQVIQRILGNKWVKFFQFSSFILMFTIGILMFLLINSSFFQVVQFILKKLNIPAAASDEISFTKYSMQWQCMGLMCVFAPLFFFKSINIFIRMSKYGVVAIYSYVIFIIYIFIENWVSGRLVESNVPMVSWTFKHISVMIGNLVTSFMIQNEITQLVSTNKFKQNNQRDSTISFAMVSFVLGSVGILGSLGLGGRKATVSHPITIYDYFEGENIFSFIVASLFFVQQFTVLPWFNFASRNHFFGLVYGKGSKVPQKSLILYNAIYIIICVICQIFLVDPNIVIGIIGSVIGFIIVYLIPIEIRERSYYYYQEIGQVEKDHLHDVEKPNNLLQIPTNNQIKSLISLPGTEKINGSHEDIDSNSKPLSQQNQDTDLKIPQNSVFQNQIQYKNRKVTKLARSIKYLLYFLGISFTIIQLAQLIITHL